MHDAYVKEIIRDKGSEVWTVPADATAFEALGVMADKNVGAVVVTGGPDRVIGIMSERDYARKVVLQERLSRETPVAQIMSDEVQCVGMDHTCDDCMRLFTDRRIRHLPVIDDGKLAGIVSIGDVVNKIISEQQATLTDLENFITGAAYGG